MTNQTLHNTEYTRLLRVIADMTDSLAMLVSIAETTTDAKALAEATADIYQQEANIDKMIARANEEFLNSRDENRRRLFAHRANISGDKWTGYSRQQAYMALDTAITYNNYALFVVSGTENKSLKYTETPNNEKMELLAVAGSPLSNTKNAWCIIAREHKHTPATIHTSITRESKRARAMVEKTLSELGYRYQ